MDNTSHDSQSCRASKESWDAKETWVVAGFALGVAIVAFFYCFLGKRPTSYDEMGLFNPIYTYLYYSKMSYPTHLFFDEMVVHPPVHYLGIALLMRLGFGLYQAAAILVFLPTLLSLGLIVSSRFSSAVKIALMAGLFCTIYVWTHFILIRPELQLCVVWFAGLVALESARLEGWNLKKLCLGAFLSGYASGLHYWAIPAIVTPVIYAFWAVVELGVRKARSQLLALVLGVALFIVPYGLTFVIPHWPGIRAMVTGVQATGGWWQSFQNHRTNYWGHQYWVVNSPVLDWQSRRFASLLTAPVLLGGIPAILIAIVLWLIIPGSRGLALAGGFLPLFVLFGVQRKLGPLYLLPEFILYIAGLIAVGILLVRGVVSRFSQAKGWPLVLLTVTVALAIALFSQIPTSMGTQFAFTTKPLETEWEIARSAGKDIIGSKALIASSTTVTWYTSGAAYWYHVGGDLGYPQFETKDRQAYLSQFDTIPLEPYAWFVYSEKSLPIPFWYLNGELHLQGFFVDTSNPYTPLLYVSAKQPTQVVGYGYQQGQLYRFTQQSTGQHIYATMMCHLESDSAVQKGETVPHLSARPGMEFFNPIYLDMPVEGARYLSTFVMERERYERDRATLINGCTVRDEVIGQLQPVDKQPLLERLKQQDKPIQFYQSLEKALAARKQTP